MPPHSLGKGIMAHRAQKGSGRAEEQMGKFSELHFISKMLNNMQGVSRCGLVLCDQAKDLPCNTLLENKRCQKEAKEKKG